jgi:hypothetical protein
VHKGENAEEYIYFVVSYVEKSNEKECRDGRS